jgi:phage-related protein
MKPIEWVGSSLKDLREFPEPVKDVFGRALLDVQFGDTPYGAKPLKGFGGASVMEIVEDHDRSTFRAVYSVRFGDVVYLLHAFQKKAKRGIATPKHELEVVQERLKAAEAHYRSHYQR